MTYGDRWQTSARGGRALIAEGTTNRGYGLWLVKIGSALVLCDDSMSGHLLEVNPTDDEMNGIRRWKALQASSHKVPKPGCLTRRKHFRFDSAGPIPQIRWSNG